MESVWIELASLDTRETLVHRASLDVLQKLIDYSLHSWLWQDCALVHNLFCFFASITYAGDKFHSHRGNRGHAKAWVGVTCHVFLQL